VSLFRSTCIERTSNGNFLASCANENLCAILESRRRRAIYADDGDNVQAGSIDRYTASADDELGYSWLAKPREKEETVGIAWVERDECMAREVVYHARMQLENGRVGERLRGSVHNTRRDMDMTAEVAATDSLMSTFDEAAWGFDARRLALARAALQARVVGGLDEVPAVLSGPLLPRPGMTVDYLPWIRAMVRIWCAGLGSGRHWVERLSGEGRAGLVS
jgi:hypothetical protein